MIGIVAHHARQTQAEHLAEQTNAAYISYDDGSWGCDRNHRRVWKWHQDNSRQDWSVVLEDDAVPVDNFTDQLTQALAVAPTPIVSLYLGTAKPEHWQPKVGLTVGNANAVDARWIVSTDLLHAVGVCIRTELIPSLLNHLNQCEIPVDAGITTWAHTNELKVGYTWPSLVDHADGPTLVEHRDGQHRIQPRVAWWHGARDDWNTTQVTMR